MWIVSALLTIMMIGGARGEDEIALIAQRIALETLIVDTHVDIPPLGGSLCYLTESWVIGHCRKRS